VIQQFRLQSDFIGYRGFGLRLGERGFGDVAEIVEHVAAVESRGEIT
jgi:hypothetical protein